MDQSLKKQNLPKITQGEMDNLNSPITIKETEFMLKYLSKRKAPGPDSFTGKFYQTFKE